MLSKSAAAGGVQRMRNLDAKHRFKARVHLIFLDELAAVGIGFGFKNGGAKIGVIDEAQGGV